MDLDRLEMEDPSLPQAVAIQSQPPQLKEAAAVAGKTARKLQERIKSSEKNDIAKLAVAELDIRGRLNEAEEGRVAQTKDKRMKVDREEMALQAKLLDAMERVTQLQREKLAVEQSTAAVQKRLSNAEMKIPELEAERIDAENVDFDAQLHNGYQIEYYQDPQRVLQQENRVLSSQWEVDRNAIKIISHDPIGSGGWGTIHKREVKRCGKCDAQKGIIRQTIFEVHHLQFLLSGMDTNLCCSFKQNRVKESKV